MEDGDSFYTESTMFVKTQLSKDGNGSPRSALLEQRAQGSVIKVWSRKEFWSKGLIQTSELKCNFHFPVIQNILCL